MKTPPLYWTESCRWGTSTHFWLDTGHDLTRTSIRGAKQWYSNPCEQTLLPSNNMLAPSSWSLHVLDGHMATRQPLRGRHPFDVDSGAGFLFSSFGPCCTLKQLIQCHSNPSLHWPITNRLQETMNGVSLVTISCHPPSPRNVPCRLSKSILH